MATRSAIGIVHNGKIHAVYCHWDGYPENNGKLLVQNYSDPSKVLELIKMGDISSLDFSIDTTTFYDRDEHPRCGVDNFGFRTFANRNAFIDFYNSSWCEYYYLFMDGAWSVYSDGIGWTKVEDYLKEQSDA
jgi:hypothetical protein